MGQLHELSLLLLRVMKSIGMLLSDCCAAQMGQTDGAQYGICSSEECL